MERSATGIAPYRESERLVILDFLRGMALFGILIVNMSFYNSPIFSQSGGLSLWTDTSNQVTRMFIWFFFESKFYPLFSLLFGIGFYLFMQKAEESMRELTSRYRIRLAYLLLFGLLHVFLLWHGDILVVYAIFGFVMTWFRKSSNKTLIVTSVVFLLIPVMLTAAVVALIELAKMLPEAAVEIESGFAGQQEYIKERISMALTTYSEGSYAEIFRMRLNEYSFVLGGVIFMFPNIISFFLIGIYMGRNRVFADPGTRLRRLRKLFLWSLPAALVFNAIYLYYASSGSFTTPDINLLLMITGAIFGGASMMFVYLYLFTLMFHKGVFGRLGRVISTAGRMAFTNYLTQTIICTTIFYSYGFGLYGKVNYWQGVIIAIMLFTIQLIWSHYWLKRFRFGPFEWLWRTLTYGKRQPMR